MPTHKTGKLIVFEGADGAGKSSVCNAYVAELRARDIPAKLLAFPGNDPGTLGRLIYDIHHRQRDFGVESITPLALQALHIAAHLDAIERVIAPSLESGEWIVLDRYWWSTWVYGNVAGASVELLDALINVERLAWADWRPTLAYYVTRQYPLRPEPPDVWRRLQTTYAQIVAAEEGVTTVHVLQNEGAVTSTVRDAVARLDAQLDSPI